MALTLQDVREKYPQYSHIPDQDLADKLHEKYYSSMDKDEYYKKINFQPSTQQAAPNKSFNIRDLPGLTIPTGEEARGMAKNIGLGAVEALGQGGQYLAKKLTGGYAPQVNFNQMGSSVEDPRYPGATAIGKGIPAGVTGGASLPGQVLAGAFQNASEAQPGHELSEAAKGGAESAILPSILHGLEKLRPSNIFRGNLSPEELRANVTASQGTPTDIGNVVGSPTLKRIYENQLANAPFSGAANKLQEAGSAVKSEGENILGKFLGNESPDNITDQLSDALINAEKKQRGIKSNLYNETNRIADTDPNFKMDLSNFAKKAQDRSTLINEMGLLKTEPDIQKIYNKLQNYRNPTNKTITQGAILDKFGQPLSETINEDKPNLQEANLLKSRLKNYADMARKSPDPAQRNLANVYDDLHRSLKEDIKSSIDNSNNDELKNSYKNAESNYAKNYSKFLDKDVYKFIGGKKDPDTIVQSFLKSSPGNDRSKVLSKIMATLPPDKQNTFAYAYFSRALDNEGNLNPGKLATLINKLGKNQFKTLVPNEAMRNQLQNYRRLYGMNVKGVNILHNPPTGQQNSDTLMRILGGGLGGAVGSLGGPIGGMAGTAIGAIAPGLALRPLTKAMTSGNVRNKLVEAMLNQQPMYNKTGNVVGGNVLVNALKQYQKKKH